MNQVNVKYLKNLQTERLLVWVILAGLTVLFFQIYGNLAQDDAYITFRYARNLVMGRGFVYNENEWVLGTTTPLFTILLAITAYLSKLDIVKTSIVISGISLWICSGLLYELGKSSNNIGSFFLSLLFWGPETWWGLIGVIPLYTGLAGMCWPYTILGINTCRIRREAQTSAD